ncbi:MAG: sensor histidine kinase [Geminicoccaceae bacterium]
MPPRANRSSATGSAPRTHSLARRLQQQKAALAEFGVEAFGTQDLDWLLYKASELAGQGLGVQRAKVLELLPAEDKFLIRAGMGWDPDVVGKTTIEASAASPAGYALQIGTPVASEDLLADRRFSCPKVLRDHGIKSAVNVIIRGKERPYGVLEVDSQRRRRFTQDDVNFIQGLANLLAAAIDRLDVHRRLHDVADQKEILLHELQHRVKNSLQVIAGIISLQRRRSGHELVRAELGVVASRIEALRVLYAKLFLVDHQAEVNLCDYLDDLCRSLLQSHLPKEKTVDLDLECAPIQVNLDRSAPLGLVTAEFILNSIKHAFPDGRGRLSVRLEMVHDKMARLVLADNGTGLTAGTSDSGGSGLRLIDQLARQADATLSWETSRGTSLELRFAV